jgi:hypothetical protein
MLAASDVIPNPAPAPSCTTAAIHRMHYAQRAGSSADHMTQHTLEVRQSTLLLTLYFETPT